MFETRQPSTSRQTRQFQLTAALHRNPDSNVKDWFGYLNIPEQQLEGFATAIRNAPRTHNPAGEPQITFKIAGWNRNTKGKGWIKLVIDDL